MFCFPFCPWTRCLAGFTGHRCERAVLKKVSDPKRMWTQLYSVPHVIAGVSLCQRTIHSPFYAVIKIRGAISWPCSALPPFRWARLDLRTLPSVGVINWNLHVLSIPLHLIHPAKVVRRYELLFSPLNLIAHIPWQAKYCTPTFLARWQTKQQLLWVFTWEIDG